MTRIHELPENLANQIAAGEVIERPASVVKELVENAIDAHAQRITVELTDAGLKTITVTDNGTGIAGEDVPVAFRRHATSKITDRTDLFRVHTLGFRGEALPSIASVADVTLTTATKEAQAATMIRIKGGEQVAFEPTAHRPGTVVTVAGLFYNTPARLKYLKAPATELAHTSDLLSRMALGHPEISFRLVNNGRTLLQTAGNGKMQQVISAVYGVRVAREMLAVDQQDLDFHVTGYIAKPTMTRAAKKYMTTLINGRTVINPVLRAAIQEGYGTKLMVGRFPIAVINIQLDPLLVDVNVHPTKQEVRLSKEDQLVTLITAAIQEGLAGANLIPAATGHHGHWESSSRTKHSQQLDFQTSLHAQAVRNRVHAAVMGASPVAPSRAQKEQVVATDDHPATITIKSRADLTSPIMQAWDRHYQVKVSGENGKVHEGERFPRLQYLGQVHGTYLLAEGADGLYLIDQHAAHERVKYEEITTAAANEHVSMQELLVPVVLSYPASDALIVSERLGDLKQLGLTLTDFGQNTFIVREHPTWMGRADVAEQIRTIVDTVITHRKITLARLREAALAMASCKRAIKANHHLEPAQGQALLAHLAECTNPYNCPHGRPTTIHFTANELQRMFKRIQDPHHSKRSWNQ
ncbi:DNA mismatch repair endonuclease MutL [Ligilactobacillus sp. LYQ60]|uniref:DNA mismatch repair endonuclease MutL n=1 Tax=unclassified Ligilactobacillus TaxID=2767920 RepID=UPI003852913F